jgi:hypothetical protein
MHVSFCDEFLPTVRECYSFKFRRTRRLIGRRPQLTRQAASVFRPTSPSMVSIRKYLYEETRRRSRTRVPFCDEFLPTVRECNSFKLRRTRRLIGAQAVADMASPTPLFARRVPLQLSFGNIFIRRRLVGEVECACPSAMGFFQQ